MSTTAPTGASSSDYPTSSPNRKQRPNWVLRIVVAIVLLVGAASVLMPSMCKAGKTANKAKCASNLHQIGLAISLYASDHAGVYPDSAATILANEQLTSAVFVCPSSNDEAADGDSPAATAANMLKPHHLSYVYVGRGFTGASVKDDTLIAYELPENHQADGMNMLFGDGHVEWETMPAAKLLIAKVVATQP